MIAEDQLVEYGVASQAPRRGCQKGNQSRADEQNGRAAFGKTEDTSQTEASG
jgi:hypothetical protein